MYFFPFVKQEPFRDFLFASLDQVALSKWGLQLKERICSLKSKLFPLRIDANC